MTEENTPLRHRIARELPARGLLGLAVAWSVAVVVAFPISEFGGMEFLDLPLGAYIAGQGALVGLVLVGVQAVRSE